MNEDPSWGGAARLLFIVVTLALVILYVARNGLPW